ncbi:MAG: hypothetical protein QXS85_02475 [Acidilobaceae archaeon]
MGKRVECRARDLLDSVYSRLEILESHLRVRVSEERGLPVILETLDKIYDELALLKKEIDKLCGTI